MANANKNRLLIPFKQFLSGLEFDGEGKVDANSLRIAREREFQNYKAIELWAYNLEKRLDAELPVSDWDQYVASLIPYAWWKLDEADGTDVAIDSSGNARNGQYNSTTSPVRGGAALVFGSVNSVSTVSSVPHLKDNVANFMSGLTTDSWTAGAWLKSSASGGDVWIRAVGAFVGLNCYLNFNVVTNLAEAGCVSMIYDAGGANANGLAASSTNWNNGASGLVMFEYNEVADTIAIWVRGVKVASRTMPVAKPTISAQYEWMNNVNTVEVDEYLFFNRILSETEHVTLASYIP